MSAAELEAAVRATGLLAPGRPVVALLSGGRDSVCLLDLAVRIGAAVRALHVDYGLRDGAAQDARACVDLCERLGVALAVRRPRRPLDARGNLQAWARDRRYGEAALLAHAHDADIASGHTATDQVETVLYRLAASPGRHALLAMRPRDGRLVRPLLAAGVAREQTAAYCEERGLQWREDPSNDSEAYARNRVRAGLLEALRAIHPAAESNVLRTVALLRDEAAVLDAIVAEALERAGDPPRVAALAALPDALQRLALQRLADDAVGGRGPVVGHRAREILTLGPGGALDVGEGLRAHVASPEPALSFRSDSAGRARPRASRRGREAPWRREPPW